MNQNKIKGIDFKNTALIACEESQAVAKAFLSMGVNAVSCDLLPCSGGLPDIHIQGDILPLLEYPWAMVIAFPPCTHLAVSGAAWFKQKQADGRQQQGINFFMEFTKKDVPFAIENPVGIMSRHYRKPDQIIHPYQFGDNASKKTCLWLNRLPKLPIDPALECPPERFVKGLPRWGNQTGSGQNRLAPSDQRATERSKTWPGIAKAMAQTWAPLV